MKNDILEFIEVFQTEGTIELFSEVACYWFTTILMCRFGGVRMYDPERIHFAIKIGDKIYDITGEVDHPEDYVEWVSYTLSAEDDAAMIVDTCILLRGGEY